jgi:hypothetical protein
MSDLPRRALECRTSRKLGNFQTAHLRSLIPALTAGVGLGKIADQTGVSRDSVCHHTGRHLSEADEAAYLAEVPLPEMLARAVDEGVSLLDFFKIVRGTLMTQFQLAASVNDRKAVAALAGKLNKTLNLIGNITGEMLRLSPGTVVNNTAVFINSPAFAATVAILQREAPILLRKTRNNDASDLALPAAIYFGSFSCLRGRCCLSRHVMLRAHWLLQSSSILPLFSVSLPRVT